MNRTKRIGLAAIIWLVPIVGIYIGVKIQNGRGLVLTIFSCGLFLPLSGVLFDAITNDKVLWLNVDRPWESHLK
jgi:hypothetical protein